MKGLPRFFAGLSLRHRRAVPACRIDRLVYDGPVYAIGDIHGCRALWRRLVDAVLADALALGRGPALLVPLGDMVDRGPDSAGVIDDFSARKGGPEVRPILGNHERMMLSFLQAPHQNLSWLEMGGYETLRSYGLALSRGEAEVMSPRRLAQVVSAHVPPEHAEWLAALPHGFRLPGTGGATLLVHAGFDSQQDDAGQSEAVLLWGRPSAAPKGGALHAAERVARVVHGHVISAQPDPLAPVIGIDTGAYLTGRLTALRLLPDADPALISVDGPTLTPARHG
jgi:serine/threonine protein phosphatase 1